MIRPALLTDFSFVYTLYMHPQVNRFLLYEPMDEQTFEPIFNDLLQKQVLFVYKANEQPAGMFKLIPLTYRTSHIAYLGGVAIHPNFGGKGNGHLLMQEILTLGKQMGLLRIELSTATINEKAIRLYEKAGFQKEGILRKYCYLKSENVFLDEVMMSYLY